jgi:hypothetical protein
VLRIRDCNISMSAARQDPLISEEDNGDVILDKLIIHDLDYVIRLEQEFGVKLKFKLMLAVDEPGGPTGYYDENDIRKVLSNKAFW